MTDFTVTVLKSHPDLSYDVEFKPNEFHLATIYITVPLGINLEEDSYSEDEKKQMLLKASPLDVMDFWQNEHIYCIKE